MSYATKELGIVKSESLLDLALVSPRVSSEKPDTLKIISGYATHAMAVQHYLEIQNLAKKLKTNLPLNIELIYGMAGESGVQRANHKGFVSLEDHTEFAYDGDFKCFYTAKPKSVHSKVYVWCRNEVPVRAYMGSANYSETAFRFPKRTETLCECDPDTALDFFKKAKVGTIDCKTANLAKDFKTKAKAEIPPKDYTRKWLTVEDDSTSPFYGCEKAYLKLLTRNGDMGDGSCLNWGVTSDGNPRMSKGSARDPNQSYIRLEGEVRKSNFFPPKDHNFTVEADDGTILTCVRAQSGAKAIETTFDNAELGRYIRKRLGLPSGAFITVEDMRRYGRLEIVFWKQDETSYFMDFSPRSKMKK